MMRRRTFLKSMAAGAAALGAPWAGAAEQRPNLVYVFADQWRADATGYAGDPNVKTPHIDGLARQSICLKNAVASCPVCSPYRGTLLTGQYPDRHGVFLNDVHLRDEAVTVGDALQGAGYHTAWIGKWHLNGRGRASYIPPENRQGFETWMVLECTHDYNHSEYYADDDPEKRVWDGYDAIAQTRAAQDLIRAHDGSRPLALFLSWGPPHNPYETAPEKYRAMYDPAAIALPPNVPKEAEAWARKDLAGYYAHCTALDDCVGDLLKTLDEAGLAANTIFVFTSDHGDMLGSQGEQRKQRPWDESVHVPFLMRYPDRFGCEGDTRTTPTNSPDIMPTLLALCGVPVPESVQGESFVPLLDGKEEPDKGVLIACYTPFGEWTRKNGGREYRGVRTARHTYVKSLDGPWLLYDNQEDPYQLHNLANSPEHAELQRALEQKLQALLKRYGDAFLPGAEYVARWGYEVDETGTVPIRG
ncbi:MAG: sulfatase [Candidatus Hydrogenedentes bacterium]|nr:sulfatase [Candidatus Hydrogenedentota bacterium]